MKDIFTESYLSLINNAYSKKYIASIQKQEQDRTNWVHHFVKQIEKNPQMLNDPETVSKLANCYWYLPSDKAKEYKPYIDKFYASLKKPNTVQESIDNFNYQDELVIFEREIGEWRPLDGYEWDAEYQDDSDEDFTEHTFSYNDQVQVSLKKDGSIDVIDPDGAHKLFKRGDYIGAKRYISNIFVTLSEINYLLGR